MTGPFAQGRDLLDGARQARQRPERERRERVERVAWRRRGEIGRVEPAAKNRPLLATERACRTSRKKRHREGAVQGHGPRLGVRAGSPTPSESASSLLAATQPQMTPQGVRASPWTPMETRPEG